MSTITQEQVEEKVKWLKRLQYIPEEEPIGTVTAVNKDDNTVSIRLGGPERVDVRPGSFNSLHVGTPTISFLFTASGTQGLFTQGVNIPHRKINKIMLATRKLDTILKMNHTLRKKKLSKGKQWVHFADITGHWNNTITSMFNRGEYIGGVKENDSRMLNELNDGNYCIMGRAWKGSNMWNDPGKDNICGECMYLGNAALGLFSTYVDSRGHNIKLTNSEGFDDYKARFEYHWNKCHS